MAVNTQIWTKEFSKNLFEVADWYSVGLNHSKYVNGATVHIPQAVVNTDLQPVAIGASQSYPVAIKEVGYSDLTYNNKMIASPPRFVEDLITAEASFSTRKVEMEAMISYMKQAMNIEIADKWATIATSSLVRTTGTTTRSNIYGMASVKRLLFQDILDARIKIIRETKGNYGTLYLVVDPVMQTDILKMTEFTSSDELSTKIAVTGWIGQVAGFQVIARSLGLPFEEDSVGVTKATVNYGDVHAATVFSGALAFSSNFVSYSVSGIKLGVEPYATGYYADVMQSHIRLGGSPVYVEASNVVKGIVSIVETT